MEETLELALEKVFRRGAVITRPEPETAVPSPGVPEATADSSLDALAGLAQQHYERALQAQRDGNWAVYGDEIKQVGTLLEQMSKKKIPPTAPTPPTKPPKK